MMQKRGDIALMTGGISGQDPDKLPRSRESRATLPHTRVTMNHAHFNASTAFTFTIRLAGF